MDRKVCIMHVVQSVGGGVERYIRMLLKYLNSDQFENVLVCSCDHDVSNYSGLVSKVIGIEMNRDISFSEDFKAIRTVRKLIKRYKPDIVYAHSSKAGAVARIADIGLKNSCVYNPHGWAFNMRSSKKKQKLYTVIEKLAAPFCDKIVCISEAEKQSALNKKICKENKLQVIFNGVDIEQYESQEDESLSRIDLDIPEDAFVVGMVGRISTQKAPDMFIRAAKYIKRTIPNAYFIIVGNGEQEADIMEYAKNNGLSDSLLITGWVDNPMSYIKLFDVSMLLSRWEGFGLVLAEYMLARKPIVATRVDAIPNIITDHVNGLLVNVDDPQEACKAVIELYNNKI